MTIQTQPASPPDTESQASQFKAIEAFVRDFYDKVDNHVPVEEYANFFDWDDFHIQNFDLLIDSFDKYQDWYQQVLQTHSEPKHTIHQLDLMRVDADQFQVDMKMEYRARVYSTDNDKTEAVRVKANIQWRLHFRKERQQFRIRNYQILGIS